MNLTFKIILDKRRTTNKNTYPLKLRVYNQSDYKELPLNIKIEDNYWDSKEQKVLSTHNEHSIFNAKIASIKSKVQKVILLAEIEERELSPADVIAALSSKVEAKKKQPASIITYGEQLAKQLLANGKVGNSFAYTTAINKLKGFVGTSNFAFEALTFKKLNEFNDSMLQEGMKVNAISVYMRTIRAVYNRAIKEGLVASTAYPFTAFRIKNEKTISRSLTIDELKSIIALRLPVDSPIWHWRNHFLLSFCLIGINFSDLLTLTGANWVEDRIIYKRRKTGKIYSLKIHPKALDILQYYVSSRTDRTKPLLPVLKQLDNPVQLKKDTWQAIKTCNSYLGKMAEGCNIEKEVSTYYARYSWANIARTLGYSKDLIAEALGHEYGNKVTGIYLDGYDNAVIDEANQHIIREVFTSCVLPL